MARLKRVTYALGQTGRIRHTSQEERVLSAPFVHRNEGKESGHGTIQ
jgi:hypothetical protein